jgi:CheY-like chemotaxis protein
VRIHSERTENRLRLLFALDQPLHQSYTLPGEPVIHILLERLAWQVTQDHPSGSGAWTLVVEIPLQETVLLVIDDNNALIELLRRYLTQTRCQVVGVNSGLEGLQLAQSLKPEAILLDIMMPNIDGWEILQRLRANPETSSIPVIVCSIFNDPGLARSLGAAHTLAKPVNRTDMLNLFSELSLV